MYTAKLTSKGQITIPKKVRDRMGISEGEAVYFVEVDGEFRMRKAVLQSPFDKWVGFLDNPTGQTVDEFIEELRGR
jgi:AbrB family looped-hinge helix DNA binding protein